jgi:hypothetical protein
MMKDEYRNLLIINNLKKAKQRLFHFNCSMNNF